MNSVCKIAYLKRDEVTLALGIEETQQLRHLHFSRTISLSIILFHTSQYSMTLLHCFNVTILRWINVSTPPQPILIWILSPPPAIRVNILNRVVAAAFMLQPPCQVINAFILLHNGWICFSYFSLTWISHWINIHKFRKMISYTLVLAISYLQKWTFRKYIFTFENGKIKRYIAVS